MKEPKSVSSRRKHKGIRNHANDLGLYDLPASCLDKCLNRIEHIVR